MRTDIGSILIRPDASMLQAMAVLSDGRQGIAFVAEDGGRLLGTVTDGDMRRAILRQEGLDAPVSSVMEKDFTYVAADVGPQEVFELMQVRTIKQVPVCDPEGQVIGLYMLEDFLESRLRPNWAVVMAGGTGRRLWPLTAYVPKPMLPVNGHPILESILEQLVFHGIRRTFISINHLGEQIVRHFGGGHRYGCSIEYLREEKPLGTGGALSLLPAPPEHPLLVTNGDLITDLNLSELLDYHDSHDGAATLCIRELTYRIPYGEVECDGEDVIRIKEKPSFQGVINAGIYVLDPELLSFVPEGKEFPLPDLLGLARERGMGVKSYLIKDEWMDIGQLEDYERASGTPQKRPSGDG
jgi:dTDP-glucose pyrophosphorylase